MNEQITQKLYKDFVDRGFATLRFNFRGVGRSQGSFDNGIGELSDAASALDWVQQIHPEAQVTWVAGVSFGALIGMQLLMRRPEIRGFLSIGAPASMYDFSFLAPCPASGIFIHGAQDTVVQPNAVQKLFDELAPRFEGRAGGYCRILQRGHRRGDAAPVSIIELLRAEESLAAPTKSLEDDEAVEE